MLGHSLCAFIEAHRAYRLRDEMVVVLDVGVWRYTAWRYATTSRSLSRSLGECRGMEAHSVGA